MSFIKYQFLISTATSKNKYPIQDSHKTIYIQSPTNRTYKLERTNQADFPIPTPGPVYYKPLVSPTKPRVQKIRRSSSHVPHEYYLSLIHI